MGTWIAVSAWKSCESLSVDWFWKPSNTLEPSLWIHSLGLRVTLLVEIWNNSVYDWVERPWSATNWCLLL
jgi:hypothetical protein